MEISNPRTHNQDKDIDSLMMRVTCGWDCGHGADRIDAADCIEQAVKLPWFTSPDSFVPPICSAQLMLVFNSGAGMSGVLSPVSSYSSNGYSMPTVPV